MKNILKMLWIFVLVPSSAFASTNLVVTAPRITMHVGDPVPPCIIEVLDGTASVGEGSTYFSSGSATCTTTATSSSAVGTYPITLHTTGLTAATGYTFSVSSSPGSYNVIAADGMGAALSNSNPYPSTITGGTSFGSTFGMVNVTNNTICDMVGDNATDNTACMQRLLTGNGIRALAGALVNTSVSGTTYTVTRVKGAMNFTTLQGGTSIVINGTTYTVASTPTSNTVMTLTTSAGTQTNVSMAILTTVDTSNSAGTITLVNGISFAGWGGSVIVNDVVYKIGSVNAAGTVITINSSETIPTLTNATLWANNWADDAGGNIPLYLYFPAGTYLMSAQLQVYGNYFTMLGDGPQTSVIRLAPNSPAFTSTTKGVDFFTIASVNYNDNFSEIFRNMGIDIGYGNPAAQAIQWTSNNMGTMSNVQIWSEDSTGIAGVYLGETYTGPTMLKNVAVYGFTQGILASSPYYEYNATADQITLVGQTKVGCQCSMLVSMQHLMSDNTVTAVAASADGSTSVGRVALLNSELLSTSTTATGITVALIPNQLYFNSVTCTGYLYCLVDQNTNWQGTTPPVQYTDSTMPSTEGGTGPALSLFDTTPASIVIAGTETPLPSDPLASTWTELNATPSAANWCPSGTLTASSTTVYLPPAVYSAPAASFTCTISSSINHINFYQAQFSSNDYSVTFNIADNSTTPLVIDSCPYNICLFNHTGSRTLVLRDTTGGYQSASGAGNLFMEDVNLNSYSTRSNAADGPTFVAGQTVIARQLDIETGESSSDAAFPYGYTGTSPQVAAVYPKIQCNGATMWILGYKTENNSQSFIGSDCKADIFGFFFYNLWKPTNTAAVAGTNPFQITNSSIFATGWQNWNGEYNGDQYWIFETRTGYTAAGEAMPGYNSSTALSGTGLPAYYSFGNGH